MIQIDVALPHGHAELLSLLPSSTVQDVRTKAQRAFGKNLTYHCQESSPGRFRASLRRGRDRGRRVPYSSRTPNATGSNRKCLCLVVSWRWCNLYLG